MKKQITGYQLQSITIDLQLTIILDYDKIKKLSKKVFLKMQKFPS